ncbi:uncharacterized protein LOC143535997 [Bidens hawaiensis]|uniref:uncharacterized protein LOC143535997 n=1 Tax=Bidens hawaiensis TaxID=980011 RepID=UPI00404A1DD8
MTVACWKESVVTMSLEGLSAFISEEMSGKATPYLFKTANCFLKMPPYQDTAHLAKVGFSGNIPNQIGNLSNLKVLDLSSRQSWESQLMADDMAWISGLSKLEHLDLSGVDLSRAQNLVNLLYVIPSLSTLSLSACGLSMAQIGSHNLNFSRKLSSIKHLVSQNYFIDQLPSLLLNMTSLAFLDLSYNDLSKTLSFENLLIMIPFVSELHLLGCNIQNINLSPNNLNVSAHSNIRHMDLSLNEIEGRFPIFLTNMSSLLFLDLSDNLLNSSIPVMPNILKLDISGNNLMQIDDVGIWRHCHLKELIVSRNILEGEMIGPSTNISKCSHNALEILYLDRNALRCSIPKSLGRLANLRDLDLSFNKLTGPIPEAVGKLKSLQRLTGKIPRCLWNMSLNVMLLGSNRLSGVIPSPLGCNLSLRWLQLNGNNFKGEPPRAFGCFEELLALDLGENKISGNIPAWIGENFTRLSALRLHKNNFIGRIPHTLCKCSYLQILDLVHNNLTGSIPRCFGELDGMTNKSLYGFSDQFSGYGIMMQFVINLDLSSNKLVGEIPEELTALEALLGINLSYNHLNEGIPKTIGNMRSLNSLDFSANKLTGIIPSSMAALNFLSHLNLSHNNLSGQIPTGNQLQTLTAPSIYADNTYLCGAPLPTECSTTTRSKNKPENSDEPNKVWFYLDVVSGFATGFWGIIGVLYFKNQWRQKLFMFCEVIIDSINVAVKVTTLKMKRGREAA